MVKGSNPSAGFSYTVDGEQGAILIVLFTVRTFWRLVMLPKVFWGYLRVQAAWDEAPIPIVDLAQQQQAHRKKKAGRKVGFKEPVDPEVPSGLN